LAALELTWEKAAGTSKEEKRADTITVNRAKEPGPDNIVLITLGNRDSEVAPKAGFSPYEHTCDRFDAEKFAKDGK
jgi:hypothetical protein